MSKYYFIKGRDPERGCMTKEGVQNYLKDRSLKEVEVHPADMATKEEYFYCSENSEIGVVGESCGKQCNSYAPRNGKNGRCRFSRNLYYPDLDTLLIIKAE